MRQFKLKTNKTILLLAVLSFFVSGCGNYYDLGYEHAWEETKNDIFYSFSKKYRMGYEDGANDVYYFDLGCSDAEYENPPQYPNNREYMKGFNECA